ncbi:hypothetical protein EDEG_03283 [Edhazardia aedis USNM 41457]|uniref:Exportin-1 C-terminal domain-containing protein n=1 Tax=Edhazardia aedis (strain USNM 41457) TaxID=1003232 RepID=J9DLN4_EDHAE|nr:hypothetical protein EDEG_03283 [Edhazardia aedis USNM 41457]|eukprot:EJW02277.1 hypothetical protein EDEG_03283 [Edhazardia aedis USNM 41457]
MATQFNINEFEILIQNALDPKSAINKECESKLVAFKQDPNSLFHVDNILTQSGNINCHFIALQILEETIKHRWSFLQEDVQNNLTLYIIKHTTTASKHPIILKKLNDCLVNILKRDYPDKYSQFIEEIVNESSKDVLICTNTFNLLKNFNEEMKVSVPTIRKRKLVSKFRQEFCHVYSLVSNVLKKSDEDVLISSCLDALDSFLCWFSVRHLIECDLIDVIVMKINSKFSINAIKVLCSIVMKRNEIKKMNVLNKCEKCLNREQLSFLDGSCMNKGTLTNGPESNVKRSIYAHKDSSNLDSGLGSDNKDKYINENVKRCPDCVYNCAIKDNFLLSPFYEYGMLTTEDIEKLPILENKIVFMHNETISFLNLYFQKFKGKGNKLKDVYYSLGAQEREFIYTITEILIAFYESSGLERSSSENYKRGMQMLVKISKIDDQRLFRSIIEFFRRYTNDLAVKMPLKGKSDQANRKFNIFHRSESEKQLLSFNSALNNKNENISPEESLAELKKKVEFIEPVMFELIDVVCSNMPRPEDVYITKNEFGEIVKEKIVHSDQIEFINVMQGLLENLAILYNEYLIGTLSSKISTISQENDKWLYEKLNKICWSAGAVAKLINDENIFYTGALRELLFMCEHNYSKESKAVIASNILFLVSSFDDFLKTNQKFTRTVIKKLFEFMQESHEGIREMSCDIFEKIVNKINVSLLSDEETKENLLVYFVKNDLKYSTVYLNFHLKRTVYKGFFTMVSQIKGDKKAILQLVLNAIHLDLSVNEKEISFDNTNNNQSFNNNINNNNLKDKPDFVFTSSAANVNKIVESNVITKSICHIIKTYKELFRIIKETKNYEILVNQFFEIYAVAKPINTRNANLIKKDIVDLFVVFISTSEIPDKQLIDKIFTHIIGPESIKRDGSYFNLISEISLKCSIYTNTNTSSNNTNTGINFSCSNINTSNFNKNITNPFIICSNSFNLIQHAEPLFYIDNSYRLSRDKFILEFVIAPCLSSPAEFELIKLIKSLLSSSDTFFALLQSLPQILNSLFTKIIEGSNNINNADISYEALVILIETAYKHNSYNFFQTFTTQIIENVLAASMDKENSQTLDLQSLSLSYILQVLSKIPPINSQYDNTTFINMFITNLYQTNFKHIDKDSVVVFVDGMFILKDNYLLLRDHIVDFRFKVDNMSSNNSVKEETDLITERSSIIKKIESIYST